MTNVADVRASTRPAAALALQLVALAAAEPPARFSMLCRGHASRDIALFEEVLMELLGTPGVTSAALDIVAAAIGAHRRG
jgi:hypothetical protein